MFARAGVYPDPHCPWLLPVQSLPRGLLERRAGPNVFLVRFDPVGRYLALGGPKIQSAGAYELVEFPMEAHLSHRSSRAKFWLTEAKG